MPFDREAVRFVLLPTGLHVTTLTATASVVNLIEGLLCTVYALSLLVKQVPTTLWVFCFALAISLLLNASCVAIDLGRRLQSRWLLFVALAGNAVVLVVHVVVSAVSFYVFVSIESTSIDALRELYILLLSALLVVLHAVICAVLCKCVQYYNEKHICAKSEQPRAMIVRDAGGRVMVRVEGIAAFKLKRSTTQFVNIDAVNVHVDGVAVTDVMARLREVD